MKTEKISRKTVEELSNLESEITQELKNLFEQDAFREIQKKIETFIRQHEEFHYSLG